MLVGVSINTHDCKNLRESSNPKADYAGWCTN
jgi:hypothetical protein